jgi:hypothetical protein
MPIWAISGLSDACRREPVLRRSDNRRLSYTDLRISPLPGRPSVPQAGAVRFMESKSNEK